MKKLLQPLLVLSLLPPLAFYLAGCSAEEMGSLSELSRPYEGEYACTQLTLGGEEMLSRFSAIRLTLGEDAVLSWRTAEGSEGAAAFSYEMGEESVTFYQKGRRGAYVCTVEEGAIVFSRVVAGRLLYARFAP